MNDREKRLFEALSKIAEAANAALKGGGSTSGDEHDDHDEQDHDHDQDGHAHADIGCSIKQVPKRLQTKAAETAVKINPVNAPVFGAVAELAGVAGDIMEPGRLSVLTGKYWGPTPRQLTVSFLDNPAANLRARIISHMNAWTRTACISFVETRGVGQVRIARAADGYWSYLGTDITLIPRTRPTMNLEGFTMSTPDSEFVRVVRHETGHTMGFPHEHMRRDLVARIDPAKAYDYFLRTQGWDKRTVDQQVLTALEERSLMGTPADQTSIMCYQLPGSITRNGRPIPGGRDINATDYAFAGQIYPKPGHAMASDVKGEWSPEEDVNDPYQQV